MKDFLLTHKKELMIAAAVLTVVGIAAAFICTAMIKASDSSVEAVPEGRIYDAGVFGDEVTIHDSTHGEIVIGGSGESPESIQAAAAPAGLSEVKLISDPDEIWTTNVDVGNHTPIESVRMEDGSLGVLTIDKIGLSVNVYESPDQMEAMTKGAAHFPSTSAWDGNVGFSAHNINFDGTDGFFKNLHLLFEGDNIRYQTSLGERSYTVESVREIDASDWSPLGYTDDNKLTFITCISGKAEKRLCVQAREKEIS